MQKKKPSPQSRRRLFPLNQMKPVKLIAALFLILLSSVLVFAWYIKGAFVPWSSDRYEYMYVSDAAMALESAGFTNITCIPTDVEHLGEWIWCEPVTKISIGGETDFQESARYPAGIPVELHYQRVRRTGVPIGSQALQNYPPEVLAQMFLDAGFANVQVSEHYDLDRDFLLESDDWDLLQYYRTHRGEVPPYVNEISVGQRSQFDPGEPFPISSPVRIDVHYPNRQHTVTFHVTFPKPQKTVAAPVCIFLNENMVQQLEYGRDVSFSLELGQKAYTLAVRKQGSILESREISFVVDADMTVCCKINASDRIVLEEISVDYPQKK